MDDVRASLPNRSSMTPTTLDARARTGHRERQCATTPDGRLTDEKGVWLITEEDARDDDDDDYDDETGDERSSGEPR